MGAASSTASRCATCARSCRSEAVICARCAQLLRDAQPLLGGGPAGLDRAWSSAPCQGVARGLVCSLRSHHRLSVVALMADRIEWLAPAHMLSGAIVPVPSCEGASASAFDPAGELAAALAQRLGAPLEPCLEASHTTSTSTTRPPCIRPKNPAPRSVMLLTDALGTEATVSACARALRAAGASRVVGVAFARKSH